MGATSTPVVMVCGLGRCGSSLTMQMLAAGGMPCVGTAPDYEDPRASVAIDRAWFGTLAGAAVKVLDPQRLAVPTGVPVLVIWLDRDFQEQAKSIAKFAALMLGGEPGSWHQPDKVRGLAAGLVADRRQALVRLNGTTLVRPILPLRFEQLLTTAEASAQAMARFLAPWFKVEAAAMARVVRPRSPKCAKGLHMELALATEAQARG